jgi:four helix bundle protein
MPSVIAVLEPFTLFSPVSHFSPRTKGGTKMKEKKQKGSFEDLEVWQEGCDLAVEIYGITRTGNLSRDYGFRDQMTKAAVSIPSNIAEGKERETVPELIRFLYIAKGSAGELRTQIHIAYRIGYIESEVFRGLIKRAELLSKKLASFIRSLRRRS